MGNLRPVLIIGLLWKSSPEKFQAGVKNSRLTPWGVRTGVVAGAAVSLLLSILWGIAVSAIAVIIVSLLTQEQAQATEA